MKRVLLSLSIILLIFTACEKDSEFDFDQDISESDVSFVSIPGGAIMNYVLPRNSDIRAIQVKYNDYNGVAKVVRGSYLSKSLRIEGFNQKTEVPIEVSLVNRSGEFSQPLQMRFSTLPSASVSLLDDNLEVSPYWNGFQIKYKGIPEAMGMVHIGMVGINPVTNSLDTLLLKSYAISREDQSYKFPHTVDADNKVTIVVWTEDNRGNFVSEKIWNDYEGVAVTKMDPSAFEFFGKSEENEKYEVGWKYLFDGDCKGYNLIGTAPGIYRGWSSGYDGLKQPYIIDMKTPRTVATIYYCQPHVGVKYWEIFDPEPSYLYGNPLEGFTERSPSHIKVYGTNNIDYYEGWKYNWPEESDDFVLLGEYYQDAYTRPVELRWTKESDVFGIFPTTKEALDATPTSRLEINCELKDTKFRYVVLRVMDHYRYEANDSFEEHNLGHIIVCHEIEIYGN